MTEAAPVDKKKKKPGIWGMIKAGWEKAQLDLKAKGADISKNAFNQVVDSKVGQEAGAVIIGAGITQSVAEITDKANTFAKEGNEWMFKDNAKKESYDVIRASLVPPKDKPEDNFVKKIFKNIVARLLDAGAGVGGYISAAVVNKWTNPPEGERVDNEVMKNMVANFIATILGPKGEDEKPKKSTNSTPFSAPVPAA